MLETKSPAKMIICVHKAFDNANSHVASQPEQFRNLTFSDLHVITTAWRDPGKVLKEIREYLRLPQSTLSSIVSKLERLGLIKRAISYRDLRSYSLELTEEGKDILRQHEKVDREQAREILARLNEEERDEFTKLIQKIAAGY